MISCSVKNGAASSRPLERGRRGRPSRAPPVRPAVDLVDRDGPFGVQPGVHEDGVANLQDRLAGADPSAVGARDGPNASAYRSIRADALSSRRRDRASRRRAWRSPAWVSNAFRCRSSDRASANRSNARQHVPVITEDVHPFVIAEQHVDPPARAPRLALEAHQQIDRLANLVAAIQDVAGLDQPGGAAAPFLLGVDQAGRLEDRASPVPAPWMSPTATIRGPGGLCGATLVVSRATSARTRQGGET